MIERISRNTKPPTFLWQWPRLHRRLVRCFTRNEPWELDLSTR
jgi:hypothetical protein